MTTGEIGLLFFVIVSYFIIRTIVDNQGVILEEIAELKKEIKSLKQKTN